MSNIKKTSFKQRLKDLIAEYGKFAILVYAFISLTTYLGFYIAIKFGIQQEDSSTAEGAATYIAAYVGYKLTMPIRIGAALLLTPIIASLWHRLFRPRSLNAEKKRNIETK